MKEPNEIEQIDQEERMIFIILSIILVVAIGIIVSWYFTKEKYDNNVDDKKEPVEIIKEEKTEEKFDKLISIPIKKKEIVAINEPVVEEEIEVISKPIIDVPINLSGIVFKINKLYELPKVTAKNKEGKEFVVKTIVQYKNSNEEILELDMDENNRMLIPNDAIELIFNFKTIDQNGEEIIKVIKTPVTIEDPVNVMYTVTFNNVDDLPDLEIEALEIETLEIEANDKIEKPNKYTEFETKITLIPKDEEKEYPFTTELTFGGWYEDKDFKTMYDFEQPITKDLELYAKWGYVVEYMDLTEKGSVTLNKLIVSPEENLEYVATKVGYKFDGWYLEDDLYEFGTPVTMNLTLYAKWIEVHNPDITLEEGIESNLIGNNLDIEVDLNAIKIEENTNFLLNYSFVAPDDANHYKTNLNDEESIDIIDKQITDSVVIATSDAEGNLNVNNEPTSKTYYFYDEVDNLISFTELNINVTEAQ